MDKATLDRLTNLEMGSVSLIFLSLVIFIYLVIYSKRLVSSKIEKKSCVFLVISILCFCVFAFFDGDWFHYRDIYYEILNNSNLYDIVYKDITSFFMSNAYTHMETIYIAYILAAPANYFLFRIVVWGVSLLCTYVMVKNLGCNKVWFYYLFICVFLWTFSYSRTSLSYSLAFMGLSFLLKDKKRIINIFVGVAIILFSTLFHKSAIFLIFIIPFSFIEMTPHRILFLLFTIILIGGSFTVLSKGILLGLDGFLVAESFQAYMDNAYSASTDGSIIRIIITQYLKYLPYFAFFIIFCKMVISRDYFTWPKSIKVFANSAVLIIAASVLFLFMGGYMLFYRLIFFAIIPILVVLTHLADSKRDAKSINTIKNIGLFISFFTILYSLYFSVVKGIY